jgi:hypothetical protein
MENKNYFSPLIDGMKRILVFLLCLTAECLIAQPATKKQILRLYNGQIKEGEKLTYDYPIMQPAFFNLDGKHFDAENVAFFRNNHGFFANLSEFYGERSERYAMRIKNTGRIQLFEEIDITAYGGLDLNTSNPRRLATGEVWQFYAKDEGVLKKGNYKNLKVDLQDNPNCQTYLKSYKRLTALQIGLATVGAGLVAQQFYVGRNDSNYNKPMIAMGIIMAGSSLFFDGPKTDALWLAVDNYK